MKFFHNLLKIKGLLILILLMNVLPLKAQKNQELKLAASLARSGSYEEALELYLKLYEKGLYSFQIINGISQSYEKLNHFPEMVSFFQKLSKKYPAYINHKITLGRALYLNRQKEEAQKVWQEVLTQEPVQPTNYRLVGLALVGLNLYKEAIGVYRQSLQKFKKQERLYGEIARLYQAQLDYEKATDYYLRYYRHFKKQKSYVQSRLISMTKDKESIPLLLKGLSAFKKNMRADPFIKEMEASFHIRVKDFEKAYAIYLDLHKKNPGQNFLPRFARTAFANRSYIFALKAYRVLINDQKGMTRQAAYFYEIGKIHYTQGRNFTATGNAAKGQEYVQKALSQLKKLSAVNINPAIRANSLELRGDIQHDYFGDTDLAIRLYKQSLEKNHNSATTDRIKLKLAQAYLEKNDLQAARGFYVSVTGKNHKRLASLRMAELDFYEGKFTKAQKAFELLLHRTSAEDTTVNNAIKQSMLIEQFKSDSLSLAQFAKGELLAEQKQYARAAKEFSALFDAKKNLSPAAGMQAVQLFLKLDKTMEAENMLLRFLQVYPRNDQTDQAVFSLAGIYEKQNLIPQALEFYNRLLVEFPLSFYQQQARVKARMLSAKIKERDAS